MKVSQIAGGQSYEDKEMCVVRRVTTIFPGGGEGVVEYIEHTVGEQFYWPARRAKRMSLSEFAKWAARPAGTKKLLSEQKFTDWLRGPTDRLTRNG
ncbi:MAG TPA: hypothetical protein VJJ02_03020 [Candidatus Paceibacterota bacterium]